MRGSIVAVYALAATVQALCPGASAGFAASAAERQQECVVLEYIAHATFRLTSPAGKRLVVDPFASRVWLGYDFPEDLAAGLPAAGTVLRLRSALVTTDSQLSLRSE